MDEGRRKRRDDDVNSIRIKCDAQNKLQIESFLNSFIIYCFLRPPLTDYIHSAIYPLISSFVLQTDGSIEEQLFRQNNFELFDYDL